MLGALERPWDTHLSTEASTLSTIVPDPDRWYIPPPVEAAAIRPGPGDGDLARIEALDADRMRDSLVFLAGYAPGVLDVILTATEPCLDDLFPPDADALEPYCSACGAKAVVPNNSAKLSPPVRKICASRPARAA